MVPGQRMRGPAVAGRAVRLVLSFRATPAARVVVCDVDRSAAFVRDLVDGLATHVLDETAAGLQISCFPPACIRFNLALGEAGRFCFLSVDFCVKVVIEEVLVDVLCKDCRDSGEEQNVLHHGYGLTRSGWSH